MQTTYRFFDPRNPAANWFGVQRVFDFSDTAFPHDFRPYIARLSLSEGYTEVLYPSTGGALAVMNVYNCGPGCTGPVSAPGALPLSPAWASAAGWFAIHNPSTLEGVVVKRVQTADPQGSAIGAQLWIDNDAGSNSNASSFLLMNPTAGFSGGLVTEVETLCFYNSTTWTPSLTPPPACINAPMTLFPESLTFAGQTVGVASTPQAAILKNVGADAVTIIGIGAWYRCQRRLRPGQRLSREPRSGSVLYHRRGFQTLGGRDTQRVDKHRRRSREQSPDLEPGGLGLGRAVRLTSLGCATQKWRFPHRDWGRRIAAPLSLIRVHLRSSAARYAFPLAQRENPRNRYGPQMNADERG